MSSATTFFGLEGRNLEHNLKKVAFHTLLLLAVRCWYLLVAGRVAASRPASSVSATHLRDSYHRPPRRSHPQTGTTLHRGSRKKHPAARPPGGWNLLVKPLGKAAKAGERQPFVAAPDGSQRVSAVVLCVAPCCAMHRHSCSIARCALAPQDGTLEQQCAVHTHSNCALPLLLSRRSSLRTSSCCWRGSSRGHTTRLPRRLALLALHRGKPATAACAHSLCSGRLGMDAACLRL